MEFSLFVFFFFFCSFPFGRSSIVLHCTFTTCYEKCFFLSFFSFPSEFYPKFKFRTFNLSNHSILICNQYEKNNLSSHDTPNLNAMHHLRKAWVAMGNLLSMHRAGLRIDLGHNKKFIFQIQRDWNRTVKSLVSDLNQIQQLNF